MFETWKVARCAFPYPEGWGVYREHWGLGKTILETGIPTKEEAKAIAKKLNTEAKYGNVNHK